MRNTRWYCLSGDIDLGNALALLLLLSNRCVSRVLPKKQKTSVRITGACKSSVGLYFEGGDVSRVVEVANGVRSRGGSVHDRM